MEVLFAACEQIFEIKYISLAFVGLIIEKPLFLQPFVINKYGIQTNSSGYRLKWPLSVNEYEK